MQKKLLSLVMVVSCGVAYGEDMCTKNARDTLTVLSPDDLAKPMGSLGDLVKDINEDELRIKMTAASDEIAFLKRIGREKSIDGFEKSSMKDFEKALVAEFSGEAEAIKKKFENHEKSNREEEEESRKKLWDGSLGYIWSSDPTTASVVGKGNNEIKAYRAAKDAIIKKHRNLVEQNKEEVIQALDNELADQLHLLEKQFLRGLRICGSDEDCLTRRKINWRDVQREGFFTEFATETYVVAIKIAQQKGIQVSPEDMKKIAQENTKTAYKHKKLLELQGQAQAELNKILNPEPETKPEIDLTGEDKEKPSVIEDPKEDQNK